MKMLRISFFGILCIALFNQARAASMLGYVLNLGSLSRLRLSQSPASYSAKLCVLPRTTRGARLRFYATSDPTSVPADLTSALITAIIESNAASVDVLLQQGANPTSFDDWGVSCLQMAVKKGEEEIVRSLVKAGADVNMSDMDGDTTTPLHMAVQGGHLGIVQLLLANGADVNRRDAFGCSVLKIAGMAKKNSKELASLLQPLVTEVEEPGPVDLNSLNLGSRQMTKAEADALLDRNADWEAADRGEEASGASVVQIVTDPATGAKSIRRIPLKSEFMKDLEERRRKAS